MERSGSSGCPHISCMCPNPKGAGPASQHPVGMKSTGPGVLSPLEALYNLVPISPRGKGVQYLSQDRSKRAAPLRRIVNHPYTHGHLIPSPTWEAACTPRPSISRVYLVTLYSGYSLETTLCFLCQWTRTHLVHLFQLVTMWASLI